MAAMSGRWNKKHKQTGGRVGAGGATGDKIKKPINKKDDDGNRLRCKECKSIRHMKDKCKDKLKEENKKNSSGEVMRCISCDSERHLLPECPHSWENMVNIAEGKSSSDEESLFTMGIDETVYMVSKEEDNILGGFGWNFAILDTGCNKSVAGRRWTEEYLAVLGEADKEKVQIKEVDVKQKFRFGGGKVCVATKEVKAPVSIGNKRYKLGWHVVEAPIPLL
jgi:hypothetical protein